MPPCLCQPRLCPPGVFQPRGLPRHVLARPGSDLLSHALRRSTIGAEGLHGRVRDGIGCFPLAITTRPCKHTVGQTHDGRSVRSVRVQTVRLGRTKAGANAIAAALSVSAECGRRVERQSAALPAPSCYRGRPPHRKVQRFPLHVRFSAPASCRPEKEQADRAISTG